MYLTHGDIVNRLNLSKGNVSSAIYALEIRPAKYQQKYKQSSPQPLYTVSQAKQIGKYVREHFKKAGAVICTRACNPSFIQGGIQGVSNSFWQHIDKIGNGESSK